MPKAKCLFLTSVRLHIRLRTDGDDAALHFQYAQKRAYFRGAPLAHAREFVHGFRRAQGLDEALLLRRLGQARAYFRDAQYPLIAVKIDCAPDVIDRHAGSGAVFDERVRSSGGIRPDGSRHGEDFASLLEGEPGGDERAGPVIRFDDYDGIRETGDQAIPVQELVWERGRSRSVLRKQKAVGLHDALRERHVRLRRYRSAVDAARQYGNRSPARFHATPVAGRIRSERKAGYDGYAVYGEFAGEEAGGAPSVRRHVPGSDEGDAQFVLRQRAAHEERGRRIGNDRQAIGEKGIARQDEIDPSFLHHRNVRIHGRVQ